jgi:diaminopimelate epimerase
MIAMPMSLAAASALLTAPCRPTATAGSWLGGSGAGCGAGAAGAGALAAGADASGALGLGGGRWQPATASARANPAIEKKDRGRTNADRRNGDTKCECIAASLHQKPAAWLAGAAWCKFPDALEFTKYHALGNDYLVMRPADFGPGQAQALAPRICHRNYGIGSDGILLGAPAQSGAEFELRIINPDGSEAEKSGNGLRIFARYLYDGGRVGSEPFRIATRGGVVRAQVFPERGLIRVAMGRASFDSQVVGISGPRRDVVAEAMQFGGRTLSCTGVSVGNPHCVITSVPVTEDEARSLGPIVERDPRFLNRTNVQLLEVIDRGAIRIQIWERGAGHTLASGSSASASACAARRLGLCDAHVQVHMPGGVLEVEVEPDYNVTQTGPVARVAQGSVDAETLSDGAPWPLPR